MNRLIIFLGIILAAFVLYSLHIGRYGLNDAINLLQLQEESENFETIAESEKIYAVIIDANSDKQTLGNFLKNNLNDQKFENVIVLAENHSWRGNDPAISSKEVAEFSKYKEILELAKQEKIKITLNEAAFKEASELQKLLPALKSFFGNKKIIPFLIRDIAREGEIEKLAKIFSASAKEDTLIIAALSFTENLNYLVAQFHDELAVSAIKNFDKAAIFQMDLSSRPIIYLLLRYLEEIDAKKSKIVKHEVREADSGFFVNFYKGEAVLQDRDLTVMAFGDIMFSRYVRTLMNKYGNDYVFENIKGYQNRFFEGADVIFGNLEGPIKGEGTSGGTALVFAFNEDSAPLLKRYGFTILSVANNHALDKGWEGRETTVKALENSGLGWCGHPNEEDINSVYYGKVAEKKYAFICFQDVTSAIDDQAALDLIRDVRQNVDYLLVSVHWGPEYKKIADYGSEVEPGRAFIDAGADFVIGHHPHVVQNFEIYNDKLIFYSLGNFIFDQYWSKMTQEQLGIGIVLDDADFQNSLKTKVYLFPMISEHSRPRLMNYEERQKWLEEFLKSGDYSEELKEQIRNGLIEVGG